MSSFEIHSEFDLCVYLAAIVLKKYNENLWAEINFIKYAFELSTEIVCLLSQRHWQQIKSYGMVRVVGSAYVISAQISKYKLANLF